MSDQKQRDYILFIEDDPYIRDDLTFFLENEFPELECKAMTGVTEFISHLDKLMTHPPIAVILDIMMMIGDAGVKFPDIAYTELDGGLICLQLLQQHNSTAQVPVIVVSAKSLSVMKSKLDSFPQVVSYIEKPMDEKALSRIIDIVRSVLAIIGKPYRKKQGTAKKLWSAIEAKPGVFGFRLDIRKLLKRKGRS